MTKRAAAVVGLVVGLGACTSSATSPSAGGDASPTDGGDVVGCVSDPRAESYAANMTKAGQAGVFAFVLVSSSPAPPAIDTNTWVLRVEDASGNPVPGATLSSVTPWMPDHGHGTSTPQVTDNPDGTLTVSSLYFFMPGLWQTTIVAAAGAQKDSAVFSFCVGD